MILKTKIEWTECAMSWEEFQDAGLNTVGTLVMVAGTGHPILIGDINRSNGGCGCCSCIEMETTVTGYFVIPI